MHISYFYAHFRNASADSTDSFAIEFLAMQCNSELRQRVDVRSAAASAAKKKYHGIQSYAIPCILYVVLKLESVEFSLRLHKNTSAKVCVSECVCGCLCAPVPHYHTYCSWFGHKEN